MKSGVRACRRPRSPQQLWIRVRGSGSNHEPVANFWPCMAQNGGELRRQIQTLAHDGSARFSYQQATAGRRRSSVLWTPTGLVGHPQPGYVRLSGHHPSINSALRPVWPTRFPPGPRPHIKPRSTSPLLARNHVGHSELDPQLPRLS